MHLRVLAQDEIKISQHSRRQHQLYSGGYKSNREDMKEGQSCNVLGVGSGRGLRTDSLFVSMTLSKNKENYKNKRKIPFIHLYQ